MDPSCPLCQLKEGQWYAKNDHAVVMLTAYAQAPGHSLIVSRAHKQNVLDLSKEEYEAVAKMMYAARVVLREKLQVKDFVEVIQDGTNAFQTVPHVHYHLIPRKDDGLNRKEFYENVFTNRSVDWRKGEGRMPDDELYRQVMDLRSAAQKLLDRP